MVTHELTSVMLYEQFENPGENPNHDVRLSNSTPRGIHIPSWWEDALSLAAMDQGDGAGLQPALEYLFPYSHGEISQADKASLQHNQLCSVEALMQQKRAPGGFSALQDLSEETRMKLTEGTQLPAYRIIAAVFSFLYCNLLAKYFLVMLFIAAVARRNRSGVRKRSHHAHHAPSQRTPSLSQEDDQDEITSDSYLCTHQKMG